HVAWGRTPRFAAGVLTWTHLWAQNAASFEPIAAGIGAAQAAGVQEVMVTMWGNDGNECDYDSALPSVQAYADLCFGVGRDHDGTRAGFLGSCDADLETWMRAGEIDTPD